MAPGRPCRIDHEYVRHGGAEIFLEVEPLTGRRHLQAGENRTRRDWAFFIRAMLDERYPKAVKVRLVLDNLNTHTPPRSTKPSPRPRPAVWPNESSSTIRRSTAVGSISPKSNLAPWPANVWIAGLDLLNQEFNAWQIHRNNRPNPIDWQFTTSEARVKLKRRYPNL